jgi:hypothetical protein
VVATRKSLLSKCFSEEEAVPFFGHLYKSVGLSKLAHKKLCPSYLLRDVLLLVSVHCRLANGC